MGDVLAAPALGLNLGKGALELREVFAFLEFSFLQQISHPSGFFNHDGDWVVDFVRHAGGELTDRRQLAGFNHLLVHEFFFFVGPGGAYHHHARQGTRP